MTRLLASDQLRCRLDSCPAGTAGWAQYERTCLDTLTHLLVPPLQPPRVQARTLSGTERRDAVFANRQRDPATNWGLLYTDHAARIILVEFKNYASTDIGPEEVAETSSHLRKGWGRLAIMCCTKQPTASAYRRRNTIFSDDGKIILFITTADLKEMLDINDRGEDPSDLIVDSIEAFLVQHD